MKKNIIKIGAIILILAAVFASNINAQITQSNTVQIEENKNQHFQNNPCLVFGKGNCLQILVNGKPNKDISGIIKADLDIANSDGLDQWKGYVLWVYDLNTGKLLSKEKLPEEVHLTNFTGFGFIDNCQIPMGPWYCNFNLHGFASDVNFEEKDGPFDTSKQDNLNWPHHTIDGFELCSISGKYSTKTSDEQYQIIAKSDTKSIIVAGLAWAVDVGEIPQLRFCIVKTDSIKAEKFIGICTNGNIHGKGLNVEIGNYESAGITSIESKPSLNPVEILVNRPNIQQQ